MTPPLSLLIAPRLSRGRRRSGMALLISVISTIGIVLGAAVLTVGLNAMNGFEREPSNHVLVVVPHNETEPVNRPWDNWQEVLAKVQKIKGAIVATPYINFTGLVESGSNMCAIRVKGVDPQQETQPSASPTLVQNSVWAGFKAGEQQVVLRKGVADTPHVEQGDWVLTIISDADANRQLLQPKHVRLYMTGILQLSGQLGHSFTMISMQNAQQYPEMGGSVINIATKVTDVSYMNKLVRDANKVTSSCAYIKSWIGTYGYMYRDIQMVRAIIYLAMMLAIGVAYFNIVSTLMMVAKDKSGDIVVLRTFGAKDGLTRVISVWYGLLAGSTSSLFGVVTGVICALNLTSITNGIEYLIRHKFLSGDIYFIDFLPSGLHWLDVLYVPMTALLLSLLVS